LLLSTYLVYFAQSLDVTTRSLARNWKPELPSTLYGLTSSLGIFHGQHQFSAPLITAVVVKLLKVITPLRTEERLLLVTLGLRLRALGQAQVLAIAA